MYRTEKRCKLHPKEADKKKFQAKNHIFERIQDASLFIRDNYGSPVRKHIRRENTTPTVVRDMVTQKLSSQYYEKNNIVSVINTLKYMYYRHKKLIYVSIRQNHVKIFMQVINRGFRNPLANFMQLDYTTEKYINENYREKKKLNPDFEPPNIKFNNPSTWAVQNCLIGNVMQLDMKRSDGYEVDYFFTEMQKFFELVCRCRSIPDADFFLNVHDQIILHKHMIVPYKNIVGDRKIPITEYRGKKLTPILSFSSGDDYIDLPMVFPDDIQKLYKSYFIPKCSGKTDITKFAMIWSEKKPTAVFRGSATGCGFTVENNPRLRLIYLARKWATHDESMFDVALVGGDMVRFKKHASDKYVRYYIERRVKQEPENMMNLVDQSGYKYLLYLEGNVLAYRLSGMFSMGSVVIYVESEYKPWYYDLLVDRENCVKCLKVDELFKTITWCRDNDDKCEQIAKAGGKLYKEHFTKKGLLDYTATLLRAINSKL